MLDILYRTPRPRASPPSWRDLDLSTEVERSNLVPVLDAARWHGGAPPPAPPASRHRHASPSFIYFVIPRLAFLLLLRRVRRTDVLPHGFWHVPVCPTGNAPPILPATIVSGIPMGILAWFRKCLLTGDWTSCVGNA